jgi:predicted O-linked N-acetylglucosamine transferase (SPINDLY family)
VTYLGYPNTTGMTQVDYRLTDGWADPPGQEPLYTETLVRLPDVFLCYSPPQNAPEVESPPVLSNSFITFGSFNYLPKINDRVIRLWAKILTAVSDSRLVLKNKSFRDTGTCQRYIDAFASYAIDPSRISLIGYLPEKNDHLNLYNQIDIGLDTFPYNGTTTTCEALWMGVPVITLSGDCHVSRVGTSLLSCLNLEELIARNEEEYVEAAVKLSQDVERLSDFREGIRFWMAASPLCNGETFTVNLEDAYRQMWKKWCARAGDFSGERVPGWVEPSN